MVVKAWFPTYVYYADLKKGNPKKFNDDLIDECYRIRSLDKEGQKWCKKNYPGGYTSYGSIANLHQRSSTFIELSRKIQKHAIAYAKHLDMDLKGKTVQMTDFWLNIMPTHVVHGLHLHPLSFISGTYYVKTPKGCSSIKFEDPRMSKFMAAPPKVAECKPQNKQYVEYKAEAGKLVLFESWLRHEVASNQVEEDRISVSFNFGWF